MTALLITLAAVGVVAIALFFAWATRGLPHTLETLEPAVRALLRQGYDGGFLTIDVAHEKKFVQLRKYIHSRGNYGIELGFPQAEWSAEYYTKLRELCDDESMSYRVSRASGTDDPLEFLFVDFGKDYSEATIFVRRVLKEVMDVPSEARLYCKHANGTGEDRLIDS